VNDGDHVTKGQAFGEIEVMKMFMPVKVEESGVITWNVNEGAALSANELIAFVELDNPDSVATATVHEGDMEVDGWGSESTSDNKLSPHILLRQSVEVLHGAISGFSVDIDDVKNQRWMMPFVQFRIQNRFPAEIIGDKLAEYARIIADPAERATFTTLTTPLKDAAAPYVGGKSRRFAGSQRAISSYLHLLREWIAAESWFCDGISYADAVDNLRKTNKEDYETVLKICRAHELVKSTSDLAKILIRAIGDDFKGQTTLYKEHISLSAVEPCLSEIASMKGDSVYALRYRSASRLQTRTVVAVTFSMTIKRL